MSCVTGCRRLRSCNCANQGCGVHPVTLVGEERTLKACYIGTAVPGQTSPAIEFYRRGRLPVDKLLSRTLNTTNSTKASTDSTDAN